MKRLVLLTIDFPDPLIQKEIPYLAKAFDKIYLVPSIPGDIQRDELPPNVAYITLLKPATLSRVIRLVAKHSVAIFRIYAWTLFFSKDRFKYLRYVKSFLGHLVIELEKESTLTQFVESENLQGAVFYDYWFVDSTLALAELKRKKVIRHLVSRAHGFDLYQERQFEECVPFKDYRLRFLDAVFVISRHGLDHFRQGLDEKTASKIKLSYLGVPKAAPGTVPMVFPERVLVSCARLIPLKRVGLLVDVLSEVPFPLRWIHFGDGPEGDLIRAKIKALPENIKAEFKGAMANEDVLDFYRKYHVNLFVSLSSSEGLPVSMMEAQSFGIPIFACEVNGVPEIVNPTTGRLISVNSQKEEIREALIDTLDQAFDRKEIVSFFNNHFDAELTFPKFASSLLQIGQLKDESVYECKRCILSSADDPNLQLDDEGICNHCRRYDEEEKTWKLKREDPTALATVVEKIKAAGKGRAYDCILGISGGVDSTYLAWQAKQLGLRPLLVHFDNGWNSELAVKNIENIVSRLGFDLHTLVVDWEEFRDLQLAFFKASVIDLEIPTDHAMLATLYKLAVEKEIKYILSGHNNATELVLPEVWYFNKRDHVHIRAINKRFGTVPLRAFPLLTTKLKLRVQQKGIQSVALLNYMSYKKETAKQLIIAELGWRDYGGKHYESIFTRFYQGFVLIEKFKIDKRKAHLSNLICSGQLTREQALEEIGKPAYEPNLFKEDYAFVLKKLGLTTAQFQALMDAPVRKHTDYEIDRSIYDRFWILKVFRPIWLIYKKVMEARLR